MSFDTLDPARKKIAYERAAEHVSSVKREAPDKLQAIMQELSRRKRLQGLRTSIPPKLQPLLTPARYKGAHGGRGSAKSWTFAEMAVDRCISRTGTRVMCVREIQRSLEQSVKRLIEDTIARHSLQSSFRILNTHIETPGGGIIVFQGMQNHTADSIKSFEGFDIAWVEEAQSLSERSLTLLRPTIRKEDSEIWFSWNPKDPSDPVDAFLRGATPAPDSVVIEVNWEDNPHFTEILRKEMEWDRSRDIDKYDHVWGGKYERMSHARVFKNWTIEDFDSRDDEDFLFGGDWGFAVDPSVLLRMFTRRREPKKLYIDAEAYLVGCDIDDTPSLFDTVGCKQKHEHWSPIHRDAKCDGLARRWQIVSDSARPETISYMQKHGYPRCVGAKKGAGSVEDGIEFLKSYNIVVHPRCAHTIAEFKHYSWKVHPLTGEVLPILQDKNNHVVDSARYGVENLRMPRAAKVEVW